MAPKQVIFFNPHSTSPGKEPLPISLLQLAAQMDEKIPWQLVDGNFDKNPWRTIGKRINDPGQTLLAVTVMPGPQLAQAVPTCRRLKEKFSNLRILWGGYFPTQHHRVVLESGWVDHVAMGPADHSFLEFLEQWSLGKPLAVNGIINADDKPMENPPKGQFKDPQLIPDLPYERLPMERYLNRNYLGNRCICYHSSDGCPFFCSFCAVVAMAEGRWQGQPAERVATNLFKLQDHYGVDAVQFFDNNFFVSQKRCLEFSQRLLAAKRKFNWWGEGRIDTLLNFKRDTLKTMARSGLKMVFLGAETSNPETMELYQKGGNLTPEMTLELAGVFAEVGIIPEFSFVLGNPKDGPEQMKRDFEYIRKIKAINPKSEIILYLYTPVVLPGELNQSASQAGFRYPENLEAFIGEDWQRLEKRRGKRLPWGRRTHHDRLEAFETVLNAYYPTATDPNLKKWQRLSLKALAFWRFKSRCYSGPLELKALQKWFRYMRPEVEGF